MSEKPKLSKVLAEARYAATFEAESEEEVYDRKKEALVRSMLQEIGEDPDREGLRRTPLRVAKAMDFLTSGYQLSAAEIIKKALFVEDVKEMVVIRDIEFYSMCEHHMLPFFGHAHVGYLPNGKVVGLSKVARVVDCFARRLQVQERLTNQVADALIEHLGAHGVAVVMEASHTCMMMRGVQKQRSTTVSSAMRGSFETNQLTRAEFMSFIRA
ncbi:GTP cyclohydrolase I FolE [Candidatus Thiodictyon syntrophicum]|jgi:GTP cyclohydrolase I|uniref:GTP cyclohydrolase 1 n=1 Tax=Candidatus Thiodictyon syntrophicum TaxID=1166950 RepID=A0A2K8UCW6_9GAMM|nr:GTP cyclohydrolase I FolE [Candidatus Thiodictyon syntrophicum]AUB83434.1 GTP cyclohydrolase I FolE [Candidatus Thiodictyon syntrophicum]